MSRKQKHREGTGSLLNRAGKPIRNNADKAEVLKTVFASVFTCAAGPQNTASSSYKNIVC